jgi:hypothetical protein
MPKPTIQSFLLAMRAPYQRVNDRIWDNSRRRTPQLWTIHFGGPLVPEEYRMYNGWLKGNCSNSSSLSSPNARKDSNVMLDLSEKTLE